MARAMRVTGCGGLLLMVLASGCQNAGTITGSPVDSGPDKPLSFSLDAPTSYGDGCVRATAAACLASGVQYCGPIGDNCGGTIDCGG